MATGRASEPEATAWHSLPTQEVLSRLGSAEEGLQPQEAQERLRVHGPNVVAAARGPGVLRLIARQIHTPIIYLLLVSAALAAALGKGTDALVVLAAVVINAIIGFVQEYRAGKAIEALARMVPRVATVVRGGRKATVQAAELVPGDIVALAAGDHVPADVRVLWARNLAVEEAALTGESVPVQKATAPVAADAAIGDRTSVAFGGTAVTSGSGTAVVTATGGATELGRISRMLGEAQEIQTPLTRSIARVGGWLTAGVVAIGLVLLAVSLARGYPLADALLATVALAVAAIPEGLPAIITIALAIGVRRMAARRAIVRRLPSVETLGSTTVICTDKTGTLTRNEMTVRALWTPRTGACELEGVGFVPEGGLLREGEPVDAAPADVQRLVLAGALCNDASLHRGAGGWEHAGDPTEVALLVAAEKLGAPPERLRERLPRVDAVPFESEKQYMATLHGGEDAPLLLVKGAPEVVLSLCEAGADERARVREETRALASAGMRVLAMAQKRLPPGHAHVDDADLHGLELLGLQGMIDPPRPEAIRAIRECRSAGVTVKMITGDHLATAEAIGAQLGLVPEGTRGVGGPQLAAMDDTQLREAALQSNVFARVAPEHKLRLVRALQSRGNVVAMTGDGVNDAPSLKQANIGVAMGITGTAVAKEASDIVLADDNFATIAAAVQEGRRIYDNLIKSLAFVLPTNLGLGLILIASVLLFPVQLVDGRPVPLQPVLPTQLLWVNLVASVALSFPLAFEVLEPDAMRRPPRRPDEPVLGRFVIGRTVLVAVLMCAGALGLFLWEFRLESARLPSEAALREARTMAITTVIFFQIFYLWNCRSLRDSLRHIGVFSNRAVFLGIGVLLALQAGFVYLPFLQRVFSTAPLSPAEIGLAALVGSIVLPVVSVEKAVRAKRRARRAPAVQPELGPARVGAASVTPPRPRAPAWENSEGPREP